MSELMSGPVETPPSGPESALRTRLLSELKKDYALSFLYLTPQLADFDPSTSWIAAKTGQDPEWIEDRVRQFVTAGLWVVDDIWGYRVARDFLQLANMTVNEYMTMSLNLTARMSESGPCWYESMMVSTTEELKRKFFLDINRCIREFIEKSENVPAECVVAWTHGALDCLKHADTLDQQESP
jgi:hypothetical protein